MIDRPTVDVDVTIRVYITRIVVVTGVRRGITVGMIYWKTFINTSSSINTPYIKCFVETIIWRVSINWLN